ncbi:MAG: hypothetical protein ABSE87_14775 [Terracidiphilus sp.]|jgi:hypothetical protein
MPDNPDLTTAFKFIFLVERFYAGLTPPADAVDVEFGLGGNLLYAGELDSGASALVMAANIAGAASLTATADQAVQKQAVRDGVVDFLVNSVDEALRILKNEIRKRQMVAVCVGLAPETVEREMVERGVQPDLLRPDAPDAPERTLFLDQGARTVEFTAPPEDLALLTFHVTSAPAIWMPKLDAIAIACLREDPSPDAWAVRRWLLLGARYMGRQAQNVRVVNCSPQSARLFLARVQLAVERGEIGVPVWMSFNRGEESLLVHPSPPGVRESAG